MLLGELVGDSVPLLLPELLALCVLLKPPATVLLPLTLPLREAEGQAEAEVERLPVGLRVPLPLLQGVAVGLLLAQALLL